MLRRHRESLRCLAELALVGYSRKATSATGWLHPADLNDPEGFQPVGGSDYPATWISFAPIWLLAPFLEQLAIAARPCMACAE